MGIFLWYGYEKTLLQRAEAVLEAGFHRASLWWEEENGRIPQDNYRLLKKRGLELLHVHLPFEQHAGLWRGEEARRNFETNMFHWLEELNECEAALAVFHPWLREEVGFPLQEAGLDCFYKIQKRAKELGITLAAENLMQDDALFFLLHHFDDLSLCLDTGHLGVSGNGEKMKAYSTRIKALHLHDNDGKEDLHLLPGEGELDLRKMLRDVPKGVPFHLEVNALLSSHYVDVEETIFLDRAKKALDNLRRNCEGE